jgi:hypothetical protein
MKPQISFQHVVKKRTNRKSTDECNTKHFEAYNTELKHSGTLPVPSYRLATNEAFDGEKNRGAYSFCMCPGKLLRIVSFVW